MANTLDEIKDILKKIDERFDKQDALKESKPPKPPTLFGKGGPLRSIASSALALGSGKHISFGEVIGDFKSSFKNLKVGLQGIFGKTKPATGGLTQPPTLPSAATLQPGAVSPSSPLTSPLKALVTPTTGPSSGGGFFGKLAGKAGS